MVFALWAGAFGNDANAQPPTWVKISVSPTAEIRIRITALPKRQAWSFRNAHAGALGIAERVSEFKALDENGGEISVSRIATGEYRSHADVPTITYLVKLPPPSPADVAHVSWLVDDSGVLMLADLLPEQTSHALVTFSLPAGWSSQTAGDADQHGQYLFKEPDEAIFLVGRSQRKQWKPVNKNWLASVVAGKWAFKDETVSKVAAEVFQKYLALTGFTLRGPSAVLIAPLPVTTGSVKWRAETRGPTVLLLMDPSADSANWENQLGVIFTHELLHLWVPNSLSLQGDYDWFFEGFTLYTALVTALQLKFINFDEYVATLTRVYDSYLSRPDEHSLLDASERRWTGGKSAVYDKGMLVAVLYDLAIRKDSAGKKWLGSIYQELFARPFTEPVTQLANGNDVIIKLLSLTPSGADLAKSYIEGQRELDLKPLLADRKQLLKSLYYK
ncbi:MAG TPA: hypothetical protein VFT02_10425 [Pyrinomonadaceae bacterium]|nr:hypothetical protein [Pyrinomonadaceae bacterium]